MFIDTRSEYQKQFCPTCGQKVDHDVMPKPETGGTSYELRTCSVCGGSGFGRGAGRERDNFCEQCGGSGTETHIRDL